jgi:hypothetical protein
MARACFCAVYAVRDGRSQTIIDLLDSAKPKSSVSGPVQGPSL